MPTAPTSLPFPDAQEVLDVEVESRLERREEVIDAVLAAIEKRGFEPDEYFERLCLDEMITNAIVHGNCSDPTKRVRVRVLCGKDGWAWEIVDEGSGFDWKDLFRKLDAGVDQERSSGRGIALVRASGAHVEYLENGRRVRVTREAARR